MDKKAAPWGGRKIPHERIFGKTHDELNKELWDGDRLKPRVRTALLERLNGVLKKVDENWHQWTRVYFAGSMASLWWGNNDLDLLLGVNYDVLRTRVEKFEDLTDEEISRELNRRFRSEFNDEEFKAPWNDEIYHLTAYNNLDSFEITNIRPYAAFEMLENKWYVRPPHLPHWNAADFPQGTGLWMYINGIVSSIQGIMTMPEPYRTREGAALWDFLHSNRSNSFNQDGHGWYDVSNVTEKFLDQMGLWEDLLKLKKAHDKGEYSEGYEPVEWSNNPKTASSGRMDGMVAIVPPAGLLDHLLPARHAENPEDLHLTLVCFEGGHEEGQLLELPDVVSEWAEALSPLTLSVQGIGTFISPQEGGQHVLWASVNHPDLHRIHESLALHLAEHGYKVADEHGYTPHITLGYSPHHVRFIPKVHERIEFDVSHVAVHVGGKGEDQQIYNIRLGTVDNEDVRG